MILPRLATAIVLCLFAGTALAQEPAATEPPARIEIGGGFSVAAPSGNGWRGAGTPGLYSKQFESAGHTLIFNAATGPSDISREDVIRLQGQDAGEQLIKLVTHFVEKTKKAQAARIENQRMETIEAVSDIGGKFSIGKFLCGYTRIQVRDQSTLVEGVPTQLRYVEYTCIDYPDMTVAARVSYSERGREQDLSDEAMAEGERFARSLQRSGQ